LRWETHCHTVYSNRGGRRFDALNTPKQLIETAIMKGLEGIIITDHDNVKGGLIGKKISRDYKNFAVIPGAEVTSAYGHILAIGIGSNISKGLSVEETVDSIHDLGGVAVASHPFAGGRRPSLGEKCLETDAVEVFNANNRPQDNATALSAAKQHGRPTTAGSDAHWARNLGSAGIICDDPVEDIERGTARIFGKYTGAFTRRVFIARQLASAVANRPLP
jgi:predicted metal-dependent phosphoesterase TrpH